ncbi:MAG TPA: hypothetical protein PKD53_06705 [Chloroflexaceae bacterium]|nr:hypothetical protein [Chloroflexaceae bacterium]
MVQGQKLDQAREGDSTIFAALHGLLVLHPWRDPVAAESDAYSLFYARSSALGRLADAAGSDAQGLWGMNDAGHDTSSQKPGRDRIWFQVAVREPLPIGRPLPVQPLLACAGDTAARLGTLRLDAVQLLLPVQCLAPPLVASSQRDDVGALLQEAGWFADYDLHSGARVRVTLDGGQNPTIRTAAPLMLQWMQELKQDVFAGDARSLTDGAAVLQPGFVDQLWLGPALHRATFSGTLVEWSLDALGWLAALLASASARCGVSTPLVLTVSRSGSTTYSPGEARA